MRDLIPPGKTPAAGEKNLFFSTGCIEHLYAAFQACLNLKVVVSWNETEGGIPIMSTERINDLRAFKGFIEETLFNGGTDLTLDEALMNWEIENQTEEEREETLEAIQLGLDDLYAGRTVDAFEFVERMRQKFQSPAKP